MKNLIFAVITTEDFKIAMHEEMYKCEAALADIQHAYPEAHVSYYHNANSFEAQEPFSIDDFYSDRCKEFIVCPSRWPVHYIPTISMDNDRYFSSREDAVRALVETLSDCCECTLEEVRSHFNVPALSDLLIKPYTVTGAEVWQLRTNDGPSRFFYDIVGEYCVKEF